MHSSYHICEDAYGQFRRAIKCICNAASLCTEKSIMQLCEHSNLKGTTTTRVVLSALQ